jgi:hypothetical protein
MIWGQCGVEGDQVVVYLRGWRRVVATRGTIRFPLSSVVRIEHDPLARAHVRIGLHQWRKHGQGVWRIGTYHGLDGWSFWSVGLGRNAVLIECAGERLRYVVIEVADAEATVREIDVAAAKVTRLLPGAVDTNPPTRSQGPAKRSSRGRDAPSTGED